MKESTRDRLRTADRALRPTAAAVRTQAHETAVANDHLGDIRAVLDRLSAATDALHQRLDNLELVVTEMAKAAGVIDPRNSDYDQWTEVIIRQALGGGGTGIDVGAHSGLILRSIVAASPDGPHLAFEPIPGLAEGLRRDFPDVAVHEVALSDEEGEVTFHHVTTNPSYSGIRRRDYTGPEDVQLITVRTARLDALVPDDADVRFLKIDVEGAELGVLKGASGVLDRHHPVTVFEFGRGASDHYGTTPRDVHDLFAGHGMVVGLLDRYLDAREAMDLAELERQYDTGENFYFAAWAPEAAADDDGAEASDPADGP